jgi:hypothetical protein
MKTFNLSSFLPWIAWSLKLGVRATAMTTNKKDEREIRRKERDGSKRAVTYHQRVMVRNEAEAHIERALISFSVETFSSLFDN